ncbi:MAG: tRNA (adenosine(37)-N6)-threonylcarbamoyltransferase complex dimerization subunit type 1 TsaB [Oscillospiraceae bacterium]|nr:tRNA (adenosine(37)-N6)-threonylcarbamoyltransferase complex dimerization subunit type 1 TsaB [Oscillospiraceae bacterium]
MIILALESSAAACSVALCQDEQLLAQSFQNSGLTHSRTLMPMTRDMLASCGRTLDEVDVIAVAAGPGSFTGLRIGISTAKGLSWAGDKPCAQCSTLESMAWQLAHMDAVIVPVMDARRQQVYNAVFRACGGRLERLCDDRAVALEQVERELNDMPGVKILVGDGAQLCYNEWQGRVDGLRMAPVHLRWQTAWGVARAGLELARQDKLIPGQMLNADYHRLSQAEREKLARAAAVRTN